MIKQLKDIEVYLTAEKFANKIWELVSQWDYFAKDTVGKQLVKSSDSISANIAESHGRFHFQDKKNFGYFARGSFEETKSWLRKCKKRNLVNEEQMKELATDIEIIGPKLNALINSYKKSKKQITQ